MYVTGVQTEVTDQVTCGVEGLTRGHSSLGPLRPRTPPTFTTHVHPRLFVLGD